MKKKEEDIFTHKTFNNINLIYVYKSRDKIYGQDEFHVNVQLNVIQIELDTAHSTFSHENHFYPKEKRSKYVHVVDKLLKILKEKNYYDFTKICSTARYSITLTIDAKP